MYTSLNVHLSNLRSIPNSPDAKDATTVLSKALIGDPGFDETSVIVSLSPRGALPELDNPTLEESTILEAARQEVSLGSEVKLIRSTGRWTEKDAYAVLKGDVIISRAQSLDISLWRVGGPAIVLELIRASTVSSSAI